MAILKRKKLFRIVPLHGRLWKCRIDERHSLLFGLIKWWDKGSSSLSPYYKFMTTTDALKTIFEEYPDAKVLWQADLIINNLKH